MQEFQAIDERSSKHNQKLRDQEYRYDDPRQALVQRCGEACSDVPVNCKDWLTHKNLLLGLRTSFWIYFQWKLRLAAGVVIFIFIACTGSMAECNPYSNNYEDAIQQILTRIYQRDTGATTAISNLRALCPEFPAPDVYQELYDAWQAVSDPGRDEVARTFEADVNRAVGACKKWLQQYPSDPAGWRYLASAYGQAAQFHVTVRPNSWKALQYGLKTRSAVERAQELGDQTSDLLLGIGAVDYFAAKMPWFVRPFAWLIVGRGNRETGLKELRESMETGKHTKVEAAIVLASAYYQEAEYSKFENTLASVLAKYPKLLPLEAWKINGFICEADWTEAAKEASRSKGSPIWVTFQKARIALAQQQYLLANTLFTAVIAAAGGGNKSLEAWAYAGRSISHQKMGMPDPQDSQTAHGLSPAAQALTKSIFLTPGKCVR